MAVSAALCARICWGCCAPRASSGWPAGRSSPDSEARPEGSTRDGFAGMFWKAVPELNWPDDPDYRAAIMDKWRDPFGDMRQELVFIGQDLDESRIRGALDACLLSDDDLLGGQEHGQALVDPFPAWE